MSTEREELEKFLKESAEHFLDENISLDSNIVDGIIEETLAKELINEKLKPKKIEPIIIKRAPQPVEENIPHIKEISAAEELHKINLLKESIKDDIIEETSTITREIESTAQLNERIEEYNVTKPESEAEKSIYKSVFGVDFGNKLPESIINESATEDDHELIIESKNDHNFSECKTTKDFVKYAKLFLGINQPCRIIFTDNRSNGITTGGYDPNTGFIHIFTGGRAIVDVLRSIGHELVHLKQDLEGVLKPASGETGSPHENQANAIAGILMRNFQKDNPHIYDTDDESQDDPND